MFIQFLLLVSLASASIEFAQAQSSITFQDTRLEAVVRTTLNKLTGALTPEDLVKLDVLVAQGQAIANLSGLEWASNLTTLQLSGNKITDLTPLRNLGHLLQLSIDNNPIRDLSPLTQLIGLNTLDASWDRVSEADPLSGLTNLTSLALRGNFLASIQSLASLKRLTYLNLEENQIFNVAPLATLSNLTYLGLTQNPVTNWSPISSLTRIENLELRGNSISNLLFLAPLEGVRYLDLADNRISDIAPLDKLTNLSSLVIGGNPALELPALAPFTNLTSLWFFANSVTDVSALSGLTQLVYLDLSSNQISDISPLSNLTNLTGLAVSLNPVLDFGPLGMLTRLNTLTLNDDSVGDGRFLAGFPSLTDLSIQHSHLRDLSPIGGLTNLASIYGENNLLTNINALTNLGRLMQVGLTGNLLDTNADSEAMQTVEVLRSRGANVTYDPQNQPPDLSVPDLLVLTNWFVAVGKTNTLPFYISDDINSFDEMMISATCSDETVIPADGIHVKGTNGTCILEVVPQSTSPATIRLSVTEDDTGLTTLLSIPVVPLISQPVILADSSVSDAVYSALGKDENSDLTSVDLLQLTSLNLFGSSASDLSGLEGASNLVTLALDGTGVLDLSPIGNLFHLSWLSASDASISDLSPLVGLTNLVHLDLGWNDFVDLTPLSTLTNLVYLGLGGDGVVDLQFLDPLKMLTTLSMPANRIVDLSPLTNLANLTGLYIEQNLISNLVALTNLPLSSVDVSLNLLNTNSGTSTSAVLQNLLARGAFVNFDPPRILSVSGLPTRWYLSLGMTGFVPFDVEYNDLYPTDLGSSFSSSVKTVIPNQNVSTAVDPDGNWLLTFQATTTTTGATTLTITITNADGLRASAALPVTVMTPLTVSLPDSDLTEAILSAVGGTNAKVHLTDLLDLTDLNASDQGISSLVGLGFATNLTSLELDNNSISDISPIRKLPELVSLSLSNNSVSDISPLTALSLLAYLNLSENNITNYAMFLTGFSALTNLVLEGNLLDDLSFLTNSWGLTALDLNQNMLTDISPVAALTNLSSLSLQHNLLTRVDPLLSLPQLSYVDISENLLDFGEASAAFRVITNLESYAEVDLQPQRAPPIIQLPPVWSIVENVSSFLDFYIFENGVPSVGNVAVSMESSNTNVVPNENLEVDAESSDDWVLSVTPSFAQTGTTVITLSATNDAGLGTTASFIISVFSSFGLSPDFFGTSNLAWVLDIDQPWFGETNVMFEGFPTAQSASIPSGGNSTLEATLTGPGILGFWWKVSSEQDSDLLQFISSDETNMISGEVDWQYQEVAIGPGPQTVSWIYSKDPWCCSAGADAGWIARVEFRTQSWLELVSGPANGVCALAVHGLLGHSYQLQVSTDLSSWSILATISITNTVMPFLDTSASNSSRAYRLLDLAN